MDRNEFYEQMRKKIEGNLPESILAEGELVIKEARKNNDVMMHGIMISREGPGGSPVIYIDDAYDLYRNGKPVEELAPAAADAFCMEGSALHGPALPSVRGYQRSYLLQDRRCEEKQRQAFGDEVFAC